ncbi:MAG: hypothetical protein ACKOD9_19060 [Rubrivivax sp.]
MLAAGVTVFRETPVSGTPRAPLAAAASASGRPRP